MQLDFIDLGKKVIPLVPRYRDFARFLTESSQWDAARLREYQLQQLKILLSHAYENCPFYRKTFDSVGFRPEEFSDFSQFKALPILNRQEVSRQLNEIRAQNFPRYKVRHLSTSGTSTGTPLNFAENWGAAILEQMFIT